MQKKRSTHPLTDREYAPLAGRAFQIQNAESGFGIGEPNRSVLRFYISFHGCPRYRTAGEPGFFAPGNKGGTAFGTNAL